MGVHCEGVKGATAKPPCRARRREIPATRKIKPLRCGCEAVQRATAKPSGRLRRGETHATKKTSSKRTISLDAGRSRPFGATMCKWWGKRVGGRV